MTVVGVARIVVLEEALWSALEGGVVEFVAVEDEAAWDASFTCWGS